MGKTWKLSTRERKMDIPFLIFIEGGKNNLPPEIKKQ